MSGSNGRRARRWNVVHLTASPFLGGPERQMLGLGQALSDRCRSVYASFAEGGRARPFLERAAAQGCAAIELRHNAPQYRRCVQEIADLLRHERADVLCCHGYKADLLGLLAARRVQVPAVAVSRGWTGASLKVKVNEALDRCALRLMDAVVCVSEAQAAGVRSAGVPAERITVIRNAIDPGRFSGTDATYRRKLEALFVRAPRLIVGGAGRLSPEKGFAVFVEAAALALQDYADAGFVIFGDGPEREALTARIAERQLGDRILLAGFRDDLDGWLAALDVVVLASFTEGLPNVVLEAMAARVPVVATAVGGTPEVIEDGCSGFLVPPGDPAKLAERVGSLLGDARLRRDVGERGHERVRQEFTFAAQAERYLRLFDRLLEEERKRLGRSLYGLEPCTP